MGRFATSWDLTKTSWTVVKQDKELLWMPVLSFLSTVAALVAVAAITFGLTPQLITDGVWSPLNTVIGLAMYLVLAFIGVYFHAAVVAAAAERLAGGDPTLGSALRTANKHLGKLFLWAIMVATVNLLLQALRDRGGIAGQIAASIGGAAWNLATFFVVPHLMFSEDGVGGSLKASVGIFKRRWGETIAGHMGLGLAITVLTIVWVVAGIFLTILLGGLGTAGLVFGIAVTVLGAILIALVGSVLSAVYKVALYRFAQGQESGPFANLDKAVY